MSWPSDRVGRPEFPWTAALLVAAAIAAVYFLPQALYYWRARAPEVLLLENFEEVSFAVLTSRAAGEHPRQPYPYQLETGAELVMSSYSLQPLPPAALAAMARLGAVPATVVFWAGSFVFPFLIALLLVSIGWQCGIHERLHLTLLAVLSLLAAPPPFWHIIARYLTDVLSGRTPPFLLNLAYSRRFQPQFSAVIFYTAIAASLWILSASRPARRRLAAVCAGIAFGASFYSYFYAWSLLLGYFLLGAAPTWWWRREAWKSWWLAITVGAAVSIPYWMWVQPEFSGLRSAVGFFDTRRLSRSALPDLYILLAVLPLLAWLLYREPSRKQALWVPLAILLAAVVGGVQNLVTGIYISPFHYMHYFARPLLNFAFVAALVLALDSYPRLPRRVLHFALGVLILGVVLVALVVQVYRYRTSWSATSPVLAAMPALRFLKQYAKPGAVAFCPQPDVREAIPLYTDAVPYYSLYSWPQEHRREEAMLERIAVMHFLQGTSSADLVRMVDSRVWDLFVHYRIQLPNPTNRAKLKAAQQFVLDRFHQMVQAGPAASLQPPRFLVLPTDRPLESTRFPLFGSWRSIWADARYGVFERVSSGEIADEAETPR
jgi:hypothetical protein